ncbi:hypothetical protein JWJ90_04575 [Desulfobulbus rhabdoformis]|uniref:hypothetical protein n=1 Tax=Desulfobulbus rhabdoformis TaxID=34032 RepID=UPI0019649752|nr:hypothetical protein [Desulfobulbus rhabdoformis]MBM9613558.1 hypothetical protein [Desulfobulbus rhabdoformis]
MDQLTELLDVIYLNYLTPLFVGTGYVLEFLLITPFLSMHLPPLAHVILLAGVLAMFSFSLRRLLRVEQKVRQFNTDFAAKREKQQNLQLISDKQSRSALYRVTDEELNDEYNRFLAGHYARYVSIYLLPLFLILAWLNTIFTPTFLERYHGSPYLWPLPIQSMGVGGLNLTFCFLVAYIGWLIIGFQGKRLVVKGKK